MRSLKSLFIISIPFSTIKSAWSSYLMDLYNKFQFHLVRLKVSSVLHIIIHLHQFQFHLVRLKDNKARQLAYRLIFQFHLVRLKGSGIRQRNIHGIHFNSI